MSETMPVYHRNETELMLIGIKEDLACIKTDVVWLKRLFGGIVIVTGAFFGIDMSGMV